MKRIISLFLCVLLLAGVACGFGGCSANVEMTDENITKTVEKAEQALKEFDTKALKKYVDSKTLDVIIPIADKKEAFKTLGQAMFSNLTMEIKSIDAENATVTLEVINKDLMVPATAFAYDLKSNYSNAQLLTKLDDDNFINENLNPLIEKIDSAEMKKEKTEITLKVKNGKKNLMLAFDEEGEDAVSGDALSAIKSVFGV
ncbi:MAG: hypothetical protein IJR60_03210 [Eubacterium sp.]|nr:hypothetical protein [Eubacterium sp.]